MPWRNEIANYCSMMVGVVHLLVSLWAALAVLGVVHPTTEALAFLMAAATGSSGAARVGTQLAGLDR